MNTTKPARPGGDLDDWVWQVQTLEDLAEFVREHGPRTQAPLPVLNWTLGAGRSVSARLTSYDPGALDTLRAYASVFGVPVTERVEADRTVYTVRGRFGPPQVERLPRVRAVIQATVWAELDDRADGNAQHDQRLDERREPLGAQTAQTDGGQPPPDTGVEAEDDARTFEQDAHGVCGKKAVGLKGRVGRCVLGAGHWNPRSVGYDPQAVEHYDPTFGHWHPRSHAAAAGAARDAFDAGETGAAPTADGGASCT